MPTLLVSDSSVLIDLERGGLLEALFRLPYEIGVPDVTFEREIKTWQGPDLEAFGLKVLELDADGVALAQSYRMRERKLSLPDAFALALAKTGAHLLLAGDGSLRALADAEGVEYHGVLWVLDRFEQSSILNPLELLTALAKISSHPRCRLPKEEVSSRLARYKREASGPDRGR